jgi:Arc/MetJ-type ribon-helix-helix transcriptional regulator
MKKPNPKTAQVRALNTWLNKQAAADLDRLMATGEYHSIRDVVQTALRRMVEGV